MTQEQTICATMYCRQCGYELIGLSENRCPECGRVFDPTDRRTYLRHPKGWQRRMWLRRIAIGVLAATVLLAMLMTIVLAVAYQRWKAEQVVIATVRQLGGRVTIHWGHGPVLRALFGQTNPRLAGDPVHLGRGIFGCQFAQWFDRVEWVGLYKETQQGPVRSSDTWEDLAVDDALLAQLATLTDVRRIDICSQQVTDAGIEKLRHLPSNVFVSVRSPRVSPTANDLRWPDRPDVRVMKMSDRRNRPSARPAVASQPV